MRAALLLLLVCLLLPARLAAYESSTTHPGLTAQAMLQSKRLHAFLREDLGLGLGLFAQLQLRADASSRREHRELWRQLGSLDPAAGYRPDPRSGQRAAGWLMAGSVLAGMPASVEENHFYSPVLKEGLDNSQALTGELLGLLAVFEGGDRIRDFLTGTGFDLRGSSALELVRGPRGPYSAEVIYHQLAQSLAAADPRRREHHLAQALLAMGGLLHVLQDMASPTRTRNDFLVGHLQRLGSSSFDRGSAYERAVALAYGQLGLPAFRGRPVERRRVLDFFTAPDWGGLADRTAKAHFSPGTVPPRVRVLPLSKPGELRSWLTRRLPFSQPALGELDLACARRGICHLRGPQGALLGYRIDAEDRLHFFIDDETIAASARVLLPLAIGYSAGLLDFVLRGKIGLELEDETVVVRNGERGLRSVRLRLFAEDARGRRRSLGAPIELAAPAPSSVLARVARPSGGTERLIVLLEGADADGEPILAAGNLLLRSPVPPASGPATRMPVPPPAPAPSVEPPVQPEAAPAGNRPRRKAPRPRAPRQN